MTTVYCPNCANHTAHNVDADTQHLTCVKCKTTFAIAWSGTEDINNLKSQISRLNNELISSKNEIKRFQDDIRLRNHQEAIEVVRESNRYISVASAEELSTIGLEAAVTSSMFFLFLGLLFQELLEGRGSYIIGLLALITLLLGGATFYFFLKQYRKKKNLTTLQVHTARLDRIDLKNLGEVEGGINLIENERSL